MTDLSTLRSLQQRIREATGPDREIDIAISETFDHWRKTPIDGLLHPPPRIARFYTLDPDGLGPCKALMLEVLPGCVWERTKNGSIHVYRAAGALLPIGFPEIGEICANDCLTFIDAIISAAIAEEEAKQLSADHEVTGS